MQQEDAKLYLFCGKIAAGKSTLAKRLAEREATILISEDVWISNLYPEEIVTMDDYVRCSARLRDIMKPHLVGLLREGVSVALDFPANTLRQRLWLREIFEAADVAHELHFIDVPDDICKERLLIRNEKGIHAFQPSEADFDNFTSYFVPPTPDEGVNILFHYFSHK